MVDRELYETARSLLDEHGASALAEVASQVHRSRARDNPFHYARWRGVGRAILMIADPMPRGLLH